MQKSGIKMKLRTKITLAVLATALLVGIMVGSFSLMKTRQDMMELSISHTRDVAQMAASFIDGDKLVSLNPGDEETQDYAEVLDELSSFLVDGGDIAFIYTMRKRDGQLEFVVDADQESGAAIGEPYETYDVIEEALAGNVVVDEEVTTDEWGSVYSGFAPVYASDGSVAGIVGVDCSVDVINAHISAMLRTLLIIEITCFFVALVIALLVGRLMTRNVLMIRKKMEEMADRGGDLTQHIEVGSKDELGQTAESFNSFLQKLHDIIETIHETEDKLLAVSRQTDHKIDEASDELTSISGVLAGMTQSMAQTESSAQQIKNAAADAKDLSATLYEDSQKSAESAKQSSERAVRAKEKCAQDLVKVTGKVDAISEELQEKMKESERIKDIEKLTGEIVDISDQTQLLALNASIEAARAGEAGRGFAVVAEEIKNLADATTNTANEISQINQFTTSTLGSLVEMAEKMMEYIRDEVFSDYRTMEQIGSDYYEDTSAFAQQMETLHAMSRKLSQDMEQVEKSLLLMTEMTHSETVDLSEVSRAADAISENMKSVQADMQESEEMIGRMGELIGQFTV